MSCGQIWRQDVIAAQPKGQSKGPAEVMKNLKQPEFRAFMRKCWQSGMKTIKEAGLAMPDLRLPKEAKEEAPPSRKVWIDRCWQMWQQQILIPATEDKPAAGDEDGEAEAEAPKPKLFGKWRQFLASCWQEMLDVVGAKPDAAPPKKPTEDDAAEEDGEPSAVSVQNVEKQMEAMSLDPESQKPRARPQMRARWMMTCRGIWKTKVMESLPKGEPRAPQVVMMKMKQPEFRGYMRNCWKAALDILEKTGVKLPEKEGEPSDGEEKPATAEKILPSRRRWIDSCWQIWRSEISQDQERDGDVEAKPPQRDRPWAIQKWRCFMRKAWGQILEVLGVEDASAEDQEAAKKSPKGRQQQARQAWRMRFRMRMMNDPEFRAQQMAGGRGCPGKWKRMMGRMATCHGNPWPNPMMIQNWMSMPGRGRGGCRGRRTAEQAAPREEMPEDFQPQCPW